MSATKRIVSTALFGVCLLAAAPLLRAQDSGPAQCSLDTVRGTWAVYGQGIIIMAAPGSSQPVAAPMADLGVVTVDPQGHFSYKDTASLGGQIATGTVNGDIQVTPDCHGLVTYTLQPTGAPAPIPGQGTGRLIVLDNGNEARSLETANPLGKSVIVRHWRRMSWGIDPPVCSPNVTVGVYQGTYEGYVMMKTSPDQKQPVPVPESLIVAAALDYQGNIAAAGTASLGGTILDSTFPSTFQTDPDCTGTVHRTLWPKGSSAPLPGQDIDYAVALNNGNELVTLVVQNVLGPSVILGNVKRISMMPVAPSW